MTKRERKKYARGRDARPRCPRCFCWGFRRAEATADGRPSFRCVRCAYTWTCGVSGGAYLPVVQP